MLNSVFLGIYQYSNNGVSVTNVRQGLLTWRCSQVQNPFFFHKTFKIFFTKMGDPDGLRDSRSSNPFIPVGLLPLPRTSDGRRGSLGSGIIGGILQFQAIQGWKRRRRSVPILNPGFYRFINIRTRTKNQAFIIT